MNFEKKHLFWRISVDCCFCSFHSARSLSEMKTAGLFDNKSINKSTSVECGLIKTCTLKGKIISLTSSAETEVFFFLPYTAKKILFFRWNLMWKISWRLQVSCSRRRSFLNLFIILKIYVQMNGKKLVLECWSRAEAHSYSIKGNQLKHRKRQMNRITCICDICWSLFNKPVISFWKH